MLRVIGRLGDTDTVSLLRKEHTSSNVKISEAAFRAMTDWPGDDFIDEMKILASSSNVKTKILAFRAYVRMLIDYSERGQNEIVDALISFYPLADRPEEKRLVIGEMGQYGTQKALEFIVGVLEDSHLKAEAEVSFVSICEKLEKRDQFAVKSVVQEIKMTTKNESVKKRAQVILEQMKGLEELKVKSK